MAKLDPYGRNTPKAVSLHGDTAGARGSGEDAHEFGQTARRDRIPGGQPREVAGACRKDAGRRELRRRSRVPQRRRHPHRAGLRTRRQRTAGTPKEPAGALAGRPAHRRPRSQRANRQALDDLSQGATGLSLVFEGAPNAFGYGLPASPEALETVLAGVPLARTHLRIDAHPASRAMADWFVAYLTKQRADPSKLSLSFGIDPAAIFAGTGRLSMTIEALQASMPQSLAHFFALGVPGVLLEADGRVLPQRRRDRSGRTRRDARHPPPLTSGSSRMRARRLSMPRRTSALPSASTKTSSCRWPR